MSIFLLIFVPAVASVASVAAELYVYPDKPQRDEDYYEHSGGIYGHPGGDYEHSGGHYDHPGEHYDYSGGNYDHPVGHYDYSGGNYDHPGGDYDHFAKDYNDHPGGDYDHFGKDYNDHPGVDYDHHVKDYNDHPGVDYDHHVKDYNDHVIDPWPEVPECGCQDNHPDNHPDYHEHDNVVHDLPKSKTICGPTKETLHVPGIEEWCNANCFHNPPYCPESHCHCY